VIAEALLACALSVHPATLERIIAVESGGNPYALHVNHYDGPQPSKNLDNAEDAAMLARFYIAAGFSVDIGEMQVNSRNLPALGYTIEDALDPCKNIAAGGIILSSFYESAAQQYGEGQRALQAAISAYNTGSFWRGVENGYMARVAGIPNIPLDAMRAPTPRMAQVHMVAAVRRHNSDMDVW
jgi:type IV secretion system protein VirB1